MTRIFTPPVLGQFLALPLSACTTTDRGERVMKFALAAILFALFATPALAEAAGWVLVAPPRDEKGYYIRNAPVIGLWTQVAAFDNAAQCEEQRMVEIDTWKDWTKMPEGETKRFLMRRWEDEFYLRCMPYDLWWRAQQQPPR
jgi:hypothetical protein